MWGVITISEFILRQISNELPGEEPGHHVVSTQEVDRSNCLRAPCNCSLQVGISCACRARDSERCVVVESATGRSSAI